MSVVNDLEPKKVLEYFEQLTKIPRGSGNEKGVSDYLVSFAKEHGLEVIQDDVLNIIITKKATPGYEDHPKVILQGHLDMVCAKEEGLDFNFEKDPIKLLREGDFLTAEGTTLGADNGIAVAMAMAILTAGDLQHPEITALFTVDEETGMGGVLGLEKGTVDGDILINIDSEEEGVILASCAGGVRSVIDFPIIEKEAVRSEGYKVTIKGLLGGHSGMEINKNRGNAIKLMGRLLELMDRSIAYDLFDITGGEKMNAIAKRCHATIAVEDQEEIERVLEIFRRWIKEEFSTSDPSIEVTIEKNDAKKKAISNKKALITLLRLLPQGVQTMSPDIEGLVQSSTNVGVIETTATHIKLKSAIRSSKVSLKDEITDRMDLLADLTGATQMLEASYPAWEYKKESEIRPLMKKVYEKMYDETLEVEAIHAGLECGFLSEKIDDVDMVSLGPNMYDVHTPEEKVSISSVKKVYEFLVEVLKSI